MNNNPDNINKFLNVFRSPLKILGLVSIVLLLASIVTAWTYTNPPRVDCFDNGTCVNGNTKWNETSYTAESFYATSNITAGYHNTTDGRELQNGGCDAAYCVGFNFTDGTTYEVINGTTGAAEYRGTNGTAAIQTGTLKQGKTHLKCGTFSLAAGKRITMANGSWLDGEGDCTIISSPNLHNTYMVTPSTFSESGGVGALANNITISNLVFDANQPGQVSTGHTIYLTSVNGVKLYNIKSLRGNGMGVILYRSKNIFADNLYFESVGAAGRDGFHLWDSSDASIGKISGNTADDVLAITAKNYNVNNISVDSVMGVSTIARVMTIATEGAAIPETTISDINIGSVIGTSASHTVYVATTNYNNHTNIQNVNIGKVISNYSGSNGIQVSGGINGTVKNVNIGAYNINHSTQYGIYVNNTDGLNAQNGFINDAGSTSLYVIDSSNIKLKTASIDNTQSEHGVAVLGNGSHITLDDITSNITNQYPFWIGNHAPLSTLRDVKLINSYANGSAQGLELRGIITQLLITNNNFDNSTGINKHASYVGTNAGIFNNIGVAGRDHGNNADCTAITADGVGDKCFNTTRVLEMNWNGTYWVLYNETRP